MRQLSEVTTEFLVFWRERHLATLSSSRPDGSPHLVPVGATLDIENCLVRVIASSGSQKVRNVVAAGAEGALVAGRRAPLVHDRGPSRCEARR
jgi:hypothetical protein